MQTGILYVDLTRLTDADFAAALPRLATAKGIVFDVRGYPGSLWSPGAFLPDLSDKPLTSPQWLVPEVKQPDRQGVDRPGHRLEPSAQRAVPVRPEGLHHRWTRDRLRRILDRDRRTRQARCNRGCTDGRDQRDHRSIPAAGWGHFAFTGMKVLKQDGSPHHGVGIRPTIPVTQTRAGIAAGRDESLERAAEAVANQR